MIRNCTRHYAILVIVALLAMLSLENVGEAHGATWKRGGVEQGKWLVGFRAGFAPLTQELRRNFSTEVGSLVNFQGLYSFNRFVLVGLTLEWERHDVDQENPFVELGHI